MFPDLYKMPLPLLAHCFLVIVVFLQIASSPSFAAVSVDSVYNGIWSTSVAPWPNPSAIHYRIGQGFTYMEVANIQTAMQQISQDMNNCIRFTPYVDDAHRGHDFIQISKNMFDSSIINPPTPTQTCFSFPGRVTMQYGKGQALYMASGVDGCLHSVREIMRYLVRALGLEDEMNRPDRHYYINVVSDNQLKPHLQNLGLLQRLYSARLLTGSFDYKSITLPSVTQYTAAGHLYAAVHGAAPPSTGNTAFGGLSRLSQGDCLGLRLLYPSTCLIPTVTCPDLYANTSTVTAVITVPMIPGGPIEPPSGSGSYFK